MVDLAKLTCHFLSCNPSGNIYLAKLRVDNAAKCNSASQHWRSVQSNHSTLSYLDLLYFCHWLLVLYLTPKQVHHLVWHLHDLGVSGQSQIQNLFPSIVVHQPKQTILVSLINSLHQRLLILIGELLLRKTFNLLVGNAFRRFSIRLATESFVKNGSCRFSNRFRHHRLESFILKFSVNLLTRGDFGVCQT